MAVLDYMQFFGVRPIADPLKLAAREAQTAKNVSLRTGSLEPLKKDTLEQAAATVSTPKTIFRYTPSTWLEFTGKRSVSLSPVPDDDYNRVFIFGGTTPEVADATRITSGSAPYPSATLRLGLPRPASISATVTGTADDPNSNAESRAYTVTFVNSFGEEGPPPVEPSDIVDVREGQIVEVSLPGAPNGNYDAVTQRIYRTNNGQLQFVADADIAAASYNDAISSPNLGEIMPSEEWLEPPDDLQGHIVLPNGIMVAFRNNEVRLSEPGLPHAWPTRYSIPVDYEIVGLAVVDSGFVILTKGLPYFVSGGNPNSMVALRVKLEQSCVSADSIIEINGGVLFASPDGICFISSSSAELLTPAIWNREAWQKLSPPTMNFVYWEDLALCFYNNGSPGGFLFNPAQIEAGVVFLDTPDVEATYHDLESDQVYFSASDEIRKWDDGADLDYIWRSRKEVMGHPIQINVVQVLADSYPLSLKVYADGELQDTVLVKSDSAHRIKGGARHRFYELETKTNKAISRISAASSMVELRNAN